MDPYLQHGEQGIMFTRIMFCHSILMKYSDEYFLSEEATEILS